MCIRDSPCSKRYQLLIMLANQPIRCINSQQSSVENQSDPITQPGFVHVRLSLIHICAIIISIAGLMLPAITLSGFIFPLDSLSVGMKVVVHMMPVTLFISAARNIMIKGLGMDACLLYTSFILIDFWATTCATCVQGIPDMNEYSKRFKDDLIVIGMTNEREEKVRSMKEPVIEYYIASDTKMNMMRALEIRGIPYAILIDPQGVVHFCITRNIILDYLSLIHI